MRTAPSCKSLCGTYLPFFFAAFLAFLAIAHCLLRTCFSLSAATRARAPQRSLIFFYTVSLKRCQEEIETRRRVQGTTGVK